LLRRKNAFAVVAQSNAGGPPMSTGMLFGMAMSVELGKRTGSLQLIASEPSRHALLPSK
jgi:hypothetical protein